MTVLVDDLVGPATAAFQLGDGELFFSSMGALHRYPQGGPAAVLQGDAMGLRGVARLGADTLLAADNGLFLVDGSTLTRSPLSDAVEAQALVGGGDFVWIFTPDGLHLYRNGALRNVTLGDFDVVNAERAFGGWINSAPALWLLSGGKVLALQPNDTGVDAWRVREDLTVTSLAATGSGELWLVADGDVHFQAKDAAWRWLAFPSAVTKVISDAWSTDTWIFTGGGDYLHADDAFRPVTLPSGPVWAGSEGRLLVDANVLLQVRGRRVLTISGLPVDGIVASPLMLTVTAESGAPISTVAAHVGETALTVNAMQQIELSPAQLGAGEKFLDVTAAFSDDAPMGRGHARFMVQNVSIPTWTDDIQPIFVQHCERCHGDVPSATAHLMNTSAQWQAEITDILTVVRSGAMPLGAERLSQVDVDRIAEWANASFPE